MLCLVLATLVPRLGLRSMLRGIHTARGIKQRNRNGSD